MTELQEDIPTRCRCGKAQYKSRKTARKAARKAFPGQHLSPYECGGGWHIGHLPARVIAGDKARDQIDRSVPQPRGGVGKVTPRYAPGGRTADGVFLDEVPLFGGFDKPVAPAPVTAGERRRLKIVATIAAGYHPLHLAVAGVRLHPEAPTDVPKGTRTEPFTCGTCVHRVLVGGHARSFPKCDLPGRRTNGNATDVKTSWPACTDYEPLEKS